MKEKYTQAVYQSLAAAYPHETEFLQAVKDLFEAVDPVIAQHPEYEAHAILERLVEPERVVSFRVPWVDDHGKVQVNRGYRVQFNSTNGPYKGGLRFHPTVNESILKFLGFEQIFKNMLTGLPIGGGKGGANFDPKGKSDREVMAFCQSYMTELSKYLGSNLDVPAGDIGVGAREIGYLYGQYKRLKGPDAGILTGKPVTMGGSLGRTEATGFGLVYFLEEMLKANDDKIDGQRVMISGAGNVAFYAAKKVQERGGKVVTLSDSNGAIYDEDGIDLEAIYQIKFIDRGRIKDYLQAHPQAQYCEGSVWDLAIEADIALPCASQNEISLTQAEHLVEKGIRYLAEGANMPTQSEAVAFLKEHGVLFGPGKAANAGGVSVSALEMSQNAQKLSWTQEKVDQELHKIMKNIFIECAQAAEAYGHPNDYAMGADIAAFVKVANQMIIQGVV